MKSKYKISLIIGIALVANLAFASSAFAQPVQAPATVTPTQSRLTQALEAKAQNSVAECRAFRDNVFNVFNEKAKAIWGQKMAAFKDSVRPTGEYGCYIVPASYPDYLDAALTQGSTTTSAGIYGDPTKIPTEYTTLQTQIRNGQGVSSQAVAEAEAKYKANAESTAFISQIFGSMLVWLATVFAAFLGGIMALAGSIFDSAVWHTLTVTEAPLVVKIGWSIMRDISNMFFILILIIMGLAAILRLEEYDYRHLMGEVVIMAILVNFSQVIAVTIMNFVNYIGAIFYSGGFGVDIFKTMITIVNPVNDMATVMQGGVPASLALILGKIVFLGIGTAVFVMLAAMFVLRIVGLYVLIIFSPLAYVLDILPSTKNFAHEWWHKFIHYLIWVPVSLFMIRLVIVVVKAKDATTGGTIAGFITAPGADTSFYYFVLCAFIAAAFIVAEHAGMVGAHAVVHAAHKLAHQAQHVATGFAAKNWNNKTSKWFAPQRNEKGEVIREGMGYRMRQLGFALTNPVATTKGWMEQSHEDQHREELYAKATARDLFRNSMGKDYRRILSQKEEMEGSREYADLTVEAMVNMARKFEGTEQDPKDDHRVALERRRLLRAAAMQARVEDIAEELATAEERDENGFVNMSKFLQRYLQVGHDEESIRFIEQDLSTIGEKIDRPELMGLTGKLGVSDEEMINKQAKAQAGELGKKEAQLRARMAPQAVGMSMTTLRDSTGKIMTDENGEARYALLFDPEKAEAVKRFDTEAVRDHITRWQDRMIGAIVPGQVEPDGVTIVVDSIDQYESMKNLEKAAPQTLLSAYAAKIGAKNLKTAQYKATGFKVMIRQPNGMLRYVDKIGDAGAGQHFDKDTKELITSAEYEKIEGDKKRTKAAAEKAAAEEAARRRAEEAAREADGSDED